MARKYRTFSADFKLDTVMEGFRGEKMAGLEIGQQRRYTSNNQETRDLCNRLWYEDEYGRLCN